MPAVSIILPTYNRTRWLKIAIDSVFAQTFSDWDLVIADDGSSEETRDYLREIETRKLTVLWLPHSGNPSVVRNAALSVASGRYIAFLDSDDVWSPRKLEQQLAAMQANSRSRWSYTACDRIDADGRPLPPPLQPKTAVRSGWIFEPLLALEASVAMPTLIAERSEIAAVGAFDEQQRYGEFHDLCLRLAMRSEVVGVPDVLCSVRAHDEHYSANRIAAHGDWVRLYEKYCLLAPTASARARSSHMRARAALTLAALQGAERDVRSVWRTLRSGKALSWREPQLWHRCAIALLRPFAPWPRDTGHTTQRRDAAA
jgi:glycosyltransferase involved in cell wall biosynthesis